MYTVQVNGMWITNLDFDNWFTNESQLRCRFTLLQLGKFLVRHHASLANSEVLIDTV